MHQAVFSALRIPDVPRCQLPPVQLCVCVRKFQQTKRSLRVVHKWSTKKGVFICTCAVRCGCVECEDVWCVRTYRTIQKASLVCVQSRHDTLCCTHHDQSASNVRPRTTKVVWIIASEGVVMGTHPWRAMRRSKGIKRHKKRLASVRVDEWVKAARKRKLCAFTWGMSILITTKLGLLECCAHTSLLQFRHLKILHPSVPVVAPRDEISLGCSCDRNKVGTHVHVWRETLWLLAHLQLEHQQELIRRVCSVFSIVLLLTTQIPSLSEDPPTLSGGAASELWCSSRDISVDTPYLRVNMSDHLEDSKMYSIFTI